MNVKQKKMVAKNILEAAREVALAEQELSSAMKTAKPDPRIEITELPGLSKSQVKSWIASVTKARQELEGMRMQYEAIIKQMKNLEADEKKGITTLTEAAKQMKEKGRFLFDTENALLEFTAYTDTKRPGIKQMLFDPATTPVGDKAGELLERVAQKLGDEVANSVAEIYRETYEDLSHAAQAVKLLKVISKTASYDEARIKKAGLTDVVISIKDWLAGGTDGVVKRLLNFAGDIKRWIRGFVERTKVVKRNSESITQNISKVTSLIDDYIEAHA